MAEIKLFRFNGSDSLELVPSLAKMERNLQFLMEKHLENFLGIRLLAHEFRAGRSLRGGIDSLGIDENCCPVIIEYKRHSDDNIICQGLYYLNWLMEHQAEFIALARGKLDICQNIEFGGARVLCVASAFSRYDEDAICQIDRNIELIRYRFYGEDMLLLEFLNTSLAPFTASINPAETEESNPVGMPPALQERVRGMEPETEELYLELLAFAETLGPDVSIKFLKHYVALSRLKNFTCIQPTRSYLKLWLNLDPAAVPLEEGFSRDVSAIGHLASGNLELEVKDHDSFLRAQPLIEQAYERN